MHEIVNGDPRFRNVIQLQSYHGVHGVSFATGRSQRPPTRDRLPRRRQVLAGKRDFRGATGQRYGAYRSGLRVTLGGTLAIATLERNFRNHGERRGIALRGLLLRRPHARTPDHQRQGAQCGHHHPRTRSAPGGIN